MTPRARLFVSALVAGVLTICGADAQQWPSSRPPGPLAAHPVDFPPYEIKTLSNGLQVLVVLHHEQPSVNFRLLVRAGAVNEPADKPGVANFAAGLLNQGTKHDPLKGRSDAPDRDAGEIANLIESAGGVIGTGSGNELTSITGAVIKDQTDLMLSLAADMVQNPAFSQGEFDRRRSQSLSSLDVSYDDPDYLANLVFNRLVFGFHPYGRPAEGTRESISRLTREDLVAFHRAWFVPNNSLLAIVGDLKANEAFAAAQKAFGSWERRDVPTLKPIEPPPPTRRVVVIDRPGSAQTEIRVGHVAIPRTHQEYVPLDLAIRILGGEGANRLFGVLRSDRGLTYGASADLNTYKTSGEIVAETDTRSAATGEALRLMVDEFSRLQREPVNPLELQGAKDFLAGNFALTIEAPRAIAEQVLAHMFFGLELSEIEQYRDRVERVTTMDIQRVAKQFVKPDQLSIVLVGDAAAFASQLKAMGFAEFERIPLADLDLNSPTLRRAGRQPDQPQPRP